MACSLINKPFSGDEDDQIIPQSPDYVASFAVYITLEFMEKVTALSLDTKAQFPKGLELGEIHYINGVLTFKIFDLGEETTHEVSCTEVVGFRVLDERDLMEYWPVCSTPSGWLFEITNNGWLESEKSRAGSCIGHFYPEVKEFLIGGINECISILSYSAPTLTLHSSRSPSATR